MSTELRNVPLFVLRGHAAAINSICFLTSTLLISGDAIGVINIWDLVTRRIVKHAITHSNCSILSISLIGNVKIVSDSKQYQFISAGRDGWICQWLLGVSNNQSLQSTYVMENIDSWYSGVKHFCNVATDMAKLDPFRFYSSSESEKDVLLWDVRNGCGPNFQVKGKQCTHARTSEEDAFEQVLQSRKRSVLTISTDKLKGLPPQSDHPTGMVTALAYKTTISPSDTNISNIALNAPPSCGYVYIGFEGGIVGVIDIRKFDTVVGYALQDHKQPILNMDLNAANILSTGAPVSGMASIYFDLRIDSSNSGDMTPTVHATNPVFTPLNCKGISSIKSRQDGRVMCIGTWDHQIRLFQCKNMKPLGCIRFHDGNVNSIAFSPSPHKKHCSKSISNDAHGIRYENERNIGKGNEEGSELTNTSSEEEVYICEFATASADHTIACWNIYGR